MSKHPAAAAIFQVANQLLNVGFLLSYPLVYVILAAKHYTLSLKPEGTNSQKGILIHAASVGEVNAIRSLVHELLRLYPYTKIVITTTTITGLELAKGISGKVMAYLSVLDVQILRQAQLKKIDPGLICIVETEIWFNMLDYARKHDIPVLFLNARLSRKSLKRYLTLKPLLAYLQKSIKSIHAQSETDRNRYIQLFDVPVENAGNIKYALFLPDYDHQALRASWGFSATDFIICLGSSRPGEEAWLLSILPELRSEIENLKIILAPRHPKRLDEVRNLFSDSEIYTLSDIESVFVRDRSLFVIDKLGFLDQAYSICDIAIVGGSFFDFGGHNPLEPAFYSKPILMGKHHHSCQGSVHQLKTKDAIIICEKENLAGYLIRLFKDPGLRRKMGENAKSILTDNASALNNHLRGIGKWIN
ncbi:MAG: glycosyltransferase N-terminal domain-containing protein [Candidatus Cloacimonadaceae bacterium]|nr:glycosyltransferase N-terminal domain-containing protein [Candidatus Cloacimonadaceae bacterium]MDP3114640.1 glycosyltransferase N-terminal domain-containing protein [Candidatus Cloacimonadaceae bacterium]